MSLPPRPTVLRCGTSYPRPLSSSTLSANNHGPGTEEGRLWLSLGGDGLDASGEGEGEELGTPSPTPSACAHAVRPGAGSFSLPQRLRLSCRAQRERDPLQVANRDGRTSTPPRPARQQLAPPSRKARGTNATRPTVPRPGRGASPPVSSEQDPQLQIPRHGIPSGKKVGDALSASRPLHMQARQGHSPTLPARAFPSPLRAGGGAVPLLCALSAPLALLSPR